MRAAVSPTTLSHLLEHQSPEVREIVGDLLEASPSVQRSVAKCRLELLNTMRKYRRAGSMALVLIAAEKASEA